MTSIQTALVLGQDDDMAWCRPDCPFDGPRLRDRHPHLALGDFRPDRRARPGTIDFTAEMEPHNRVPYYVGRLLPLRSRLRSGTGHPEWIDRQAKSLAAENPSRRRVLLKADADGPSWTRRRDRPSTFDCRTRTVENIRERFVTQGFEIAVAGRPKSRVRSKVLDGDQEAKIIALRLGLPPKGFANWTLRLLAEQAVAAEDRRIGQP